MYALGGGLGHTLRGAALASALTDAGTPARVLVRSDRAWLAGKLGADAIAVERTRDAGRLRASVEAALEGCEQLIVDALPCGILGELSALPRGVRTTLLARLHHPGALPAVVAALGRYDRVVDLEPELDWLPQGALPLGPVVLPSRETDDGAPELDVLVVADDDALARFGGRLVRRLLARGAVARLWHGERSRLELGRVRPRVVVGPAGYHLTYTARALGIPHLAVPRPRRFDDQHRRARAVAELCRDPRALEARVLELLSGPPPGRRAAPCHHPADLVGAAFA